METARRTRGAALWLSLFLLGIAFGVVATVALHTNQPSLQGSGGFLSGASAARDRKFGAAYLPATALRYSADVYLVSGFDAVRALHGPPLELETCADSERADLVRRATWASNGGVQFHGQFDRVSHTVQRHGGFRSVRLATAVGGWSLAWKSPPKIMELLPRSRLVITVALVAAAFFSSCGIRISGPI